MVHFFIVAVYFFVIRATSVRWRKSTSRAFIKKLFIWAWISRVTAMVVLVIIAEYTWGRPFYVGASDAIGFSIKAEAISQILLSGKFSDIIPALQNYYWSPDNWGPIFVTSIIYTIFGPYPLMAKLFITLMGAGTTLLIYKTARELWDEKIARLSGILWAFFTLSFFYSSILLKEEFVVFFSMLALYSFIKIINARDLGIKYIVLVSVSLTAVFYFRVIAGATLISVFILTFILNKYKGHYVASLFYGSLLMALILMFVNYFGYMEIYTERVFSAHRFSSSYMAEVSRGQSYAQLVGIPVYLLMSFLAPFPSVVEIPLSARDYYLGLGHGPTYYPISGLIIWSFLNYFGLIGLYRSMKDNLGRYAPIWSFAVFYTLALGFTVMFTRVRFGYNVMPVFFILIAVGVSYRHLYPNLRYYLVFAILLIVAWNIFRLAGRGMI
jgi:4-amino-4-deoxy-L-arabinose transferase-like glycosyltransferase